MIIKITLVSAYEACFVGTVMGYYNSYRVRGNIRDTQRCWDWYVLKMLYLDYDNYVFS